MNEAERLALVLLADCPSQLPIDVASIVAQQGVIVDRHWFSSDAFCGYYGIFNGQPVITLNTHQHERRQRFTMAHELYHHLTEYDRCKKGLVRFEMCQSAHRTANRFAAALLMPKFAFALAFQHMTGFEELARHFDVSPTAAYVRAKELCLMNETIRREGIA